VSLVIATSAGCQRSAPATQHGSAQTSPAPVSAEPVPVNVAFEHAVDHKYPQGVLIKRYRGDEASVAIPDTFDGKPVVRIEGDAFKSNRTLRSIRLPTSLVEIGNMSFTNCTGLNDVVFPDTLQSIGWNAFENCGLQRVTIPRNVTQIGDVCFFGCKSLSSIEVDAANPTYASVEGVLYDKKVTTLLCCPVAKEGVLRVPASVTRIKEWAVANCNKLTQVLIPATTSTIGANAFNGCTAIREHEQRNRWKSTMQESRNVFQRQSDGTWREFDERGGKDTFSWKEVEATPEYVLLQDDSRKMQMRLRAAESEWRVTTGEQEWAPFRKGGWEEKHSGADPEKKLDPASAESLTPENARRLIASSGEVLSLPRLRELSEEVARVLATYGRERKTTRTYTVMVPVTEQRTATYTVMVCIAEDTTLSDGTQTSVTKCQPEARTRTYTVTKRVPEERTRTITFPYTLQLDALATPEPSSLAALAKHKGNLHLTGLQSLTPEQAESLVLHEGGTLVIDSVKSIDAETVKRLAIRQGGLSMNGLLALSVDTVQALATHSGDLSLNGIEEMSNDIAAALAKHNGPISLKGLKKASEEAMDMLKGQLLEWPPDLVLLTTVEQLCQAGKYDTATSLAEEELQQAEKGLGPEDTGTAKALYWLGECRRLKGFPDEADALHRRALAIREAKCGPQSPEVADSLTGLGLCQLAQGEFNEAKPLCERAMVIREQAFGPECWLTAESLHLFGTVCFEIGALDQAEALHRRALEIRKASLGEDDCRTADSLVEIGSCIRERGCPAEAVPLLYEALHIHEQTTGTNAWQIAEILEALAGCFWDQGEHAKAEPLLSKAVAITEQHWGAEHPDAIGLRTALADLRKDATSSRNASEK